MRWAEGHRTWKGVPGTTTYRLAQTSGRPIAPRMMALGFPGVDATALKLAVLGSMIYPGQPTRTKHISLIPHPSARSRLPAIATHHRVHKHHPLTHSSFPNPRTLELPKQERSRRETMSDTHYTLPRSLLVPALEHLGQQGGRGDEREVVSEEGGVVSGVVGPGVDGSVGGVGKGGVEEPG